MIKTFGLIIETPPNGMVGFVYKITFSNGEFYIGKRHFNPGWKTYKSSSNVVKQRIKDGESVTYEVLGYYMTPFTLSCQETCLILNERHNPKLLNKYISLRGTLK